MTEDKDTGPEAAIKGVVEDVKGKAKEAAGALAGRDELRREGRANRTRPRRNATSPPKKLKRRKLVPKQKPMKRSSAHTKTDLFYRTATPSGHGVGRSGLKRSPHAPLTVATSAVIFNVETVYSRLILEASLGCAAALRRVSLAYDSPRCSAKLGPTAVTPYSAWNRAKASRSPVAATSSIVPI